MDFYEELGVTRSASPEEIRHAWKRLARLFHPDVQGDAELRSTAELQMRRLNYMVEILSDPRRRRQYDVSLHRLSHPFPFTPPPPPPPPEQPWLRRLIHFDGKAVVWLIAGALSAGGVLFLLGKDEPAIPNDAAVVESGSATASRAQGAAPVDKAVSAAPVHLPPAAAPADDELDRLNPSEQTPATDASNPPQPAPAAVPVPAPIEHKTLPPIKPITVARVERKKVVPEPRKAPAVKPEHAHPVIAESRPVPVVSRDHLHETGLSGLWRLRNAPTNIPKGAFAAERVEVSIRERSGQIYGTYNGKYSVPEQVASSTVAFQFTGPMDAKATKMAWFSPDGNSGEISLHPLSKDSLEVVWVATHITRHGILASGRAILARSN